MLAALVLALTLVSSGAHQHDGHLAAGASCAVCVVAKHAPAVVVAVTAACLVAIASESTPAAPGLRLVYAARRPFSGRAPPHLHV